MNGVVMPVVNELVKNFHTFWKMATPPTSPHSPSLVACPWPRLLHFLTIKEVIPGRARGLQDPEFQCNSIGWCLHQTSCICILKLSSINETGTVLEAVSLESDCITTALLPE